MLYASYNSYNQPTEDFLSQCENGNWKAQSFKYFFIFIQFYWYFIFRKKNLIYMCQYPCFIFTAAFSENDTELDSRLLLNTFTLKIAHVFRGIQSEITLWPQMLKLYSRELSNNVNNCHHYITRVVFALFNHRNYVNIKGKDYYSEFALTRIFPNTQVCRICLWIPWNIL